MTSEAYHAPRDRPLPTSSPEALRLQANHSRAEFLDLVMTRADERGYGEVRRAVVSDLRGRILEIGCGTGAMFDYYGPAASVVAIEPEADFFELAVKRARRTEWFAPRAFFAPSSMCVAKIALPGC